MQYKTYQEAKIANPDCEILSKKCEGIFKAIKNPEINHFIDGWQICKPKDHCISLESFLASGKRTVKGDIVVGKNGKAITVEAEYIINMPTETDCEIYVLKAKALENPAHEWVNGDECRYINDPSHDYIYIGVHPHGDGHFVFSERKGITYIANGCIIEPETQNEKAKREALDMLKPDGYGIASSMVESIVDKLSNAGMLKSKDEK